MIRKNEIKDRLSVVPSSGFKKFFSQEEILVLPDFNPNSRLIKICSLEELDSGIINLLPPVIALALKNKNQPEFKKYEVVSGIEFVSPNFFLKIGRNDSCPCGSGKKYKKCCGR